MKNLIFILFIISIHSQGGPFVDTGRVSRLLSRIKNSDFEAAVTAIITLNEYWGLLNDFDGELDGTTVDDVIDDESLSDLELRKIARERINDIYKEYCDDINDLNE